MTYGRWHASQGIQIGAAARDEWYWRCPASGCRIWAGPYHHGAAGMDDKWAEHDRSAARRAEARKAARGVCSTMTAARLDEIIARLAGC